MKPVEQTIRGSERGNCLAACIASILEIPLDDVPNFIEEDDWRTSVNRFLKPWGFYLLCVSGDGDSDIRGTLPDGLMIVCGKTAPDIWHATVGRKGVTVFDPMAADAEPTFVDHERYYELFVSLDPALHRTSKGHLVKVES